MELNQFKKTLLYSEELEIDLKSKKDKEYFKWFLAGILFGARISETIAKNTYKTLEKYTILTPQKMSEPEKTAEVLSRYRRKVIALFLGANSIKRAKAILNKSKIPCIMSI